MIRRNFIAAGLAAGAASTAAGAGHNENKFKLKYGPHEGMFENLAGEKVFDQIRFAADQGFTAWEDNRAGERPIAEQKKLGALLDKLGMTMGVFVSYGLGIFESMDFVTKTDKAFQDAIKAEMQVASEVAKRVNAQWTTVVPTQVNEKLDPNYQLANCIENLKVMSEVCEQSGLVMVLEPLNWYANHPRLFLRSVPQAYAICKAVDSPSCKILDDLYHQQIDVGNLIPNMDKAWDEIAYVQVGDNPGRKEPTTGEINYKRIFEWLYNRNYGGVVGMEHGNSMPDAPGERAVIAAYREVDSF